MYFIFDCLQTQASKVLRGGGCYAARVAEAITLCRRTRHMATCTDYSSATQTRLYTPRNLKHGVVTYHRILPPCRDSIPETWLRVEAHTERQSREEQNSVSVNNIYY